MDFIIGNEGSLQANIAKNWLEDQTGDEFENTYSAMAFHTNDQIKAAALFTNYNGANVDLHFFGPRLSRGTYRQILDYVFNHLKCNRMTAIPLRSDTASIISLPRLGFRQEAILKYYYGVDDSQDGLVYVITKSKALEWLKNKGAK
jgi:hypothetical protein